MAEKLLPCPFCGGEGKREDIEAGEGVENAGASYITCARCWASTALHFDRKENLVSSWNDRHLAGVAEQVARWMIYNGYATGHGETIEDMLVELEAQAKRRA